MFRYIAVVFALFAPAIAVAQQPAQSMQDQLLLNCNNINTQLAKAIDIANMQIAELKKQLQDKNTSENKDAK